MILAIIIVLIIIVICLFFYNLSISKKIENFNNINQKITNLNILQDFMNTISEVTSVNEKIEKINNILIERYNIKYSTIVIYNGTEYVVKASNVEEKHCRFSSSKLHFLIGKSFSFFLDSNIFWCCGLSAVFRNFFILKIS